MDKQALFDLVLSELLNSDYDNQNTKNESYARQLINVHTEFVNRNRKLTTLLDKYIAQREERVNINKKFKCVLFFLFVLSFLALTITIIVIFAKTDINNSNASSTISLISVAVTYLGSIMIIFEIISKYLFPTDEEKDMISMIKTVIDNDVKVEEFMSKEIHIDETREVEALKAYKSLLDDGIITEEEFNKVKKLILDRVTFTKSC